MLALGEAVPVEAAGERELAAQAPAQLLEAEERAHRMAVAGLVRVLDGRFHLAPELVCVRRGFHDGHEQAVVSVAGVLEVAHLGVADDGFPRIGDAVGHVLDPMAGVEREHAVDAVDDLPAAVPLGHAHRRAERLVGGAVVSAQRAEGHHEVGAHLQAVRGVAVPDQAPHGCDHRPVGEAGVEEDRGAAQAAQQLRDGGLCRVTGFVEVRVAAARERFELAVEQVDLLLQHLREVLARKGDPQPLQQREAQLEGLLVPAAVGEARYLQTAAVHELDRVVQHGFERQVGPVAFVGLHQVAQHGVVLDEHLHEELPPVLLVQVGLREGQFQVALRRVEGRDEPAAMRRLQQGLLDVAPLPPVGRLAEALRVVVRDVEQALLRIVFARRLLLVAFAQQVVDPRAILRGQGGVEHLLEAVVGEPVARRRAGFRVLPGGDDGFLGRRRHQPPLYLVVGQAADGGQVVHREPCPDAGSEREQRPRLLGEPVQVLRQEVDHVLGSRAVADGSLVPAPCARLPVEIEVPPLMAEAEELLGVEGVALRLLADDARQAARSLRLRP